MQSFYLIITTEKLFLYDIMNCEWQYFEGNPYLKYSMQMIRSDVKILLEYMFDYYNMTKDSSELEFVVIKHADAIRSQLILEALNGFVKGTIEIDDVIQKIIAKLDVDVTLYINDFGVNYDGLNYKYKSNKLIQSEFNLLGYTLNEEDIINYIV